MIIRPMRLEDIEAVHQIDNHSFALPWPKSSYRFEILENPAARLWVAEDEIEPGLRGVIGLIGLWLILDEAHVSTIAVHPNHRRRGVARQLLSSALDYCRQTGARKVTLEVRAGNQAAQALYQAFGFQVVGRRPRYYYDNREDALLMTVNFESRSTGPVRG